MSNAERNAEIIRRRKAGHRVNAIVRSMGLSRNVVGAVLFRAGLTDSDSPNAHKTARPGSGGNGAVLTDEAVRLMRSQYCWGERGSGVRALAKRFGVTPTTAKAALKGKTWAHVA